MKRLRPSSSNRGVGVFLGGGSSGGPVTSVTVAGNPKLPFIADDSARPTLTAADYGAVYYNQAGRSLDVWEADGWHDLGDLFVGPDMASIAAGWGAGEEGDMAYSQAEGLLILGADPKAPGNLVWKVVGSEGTKVVADSAGLAAATGMQEGDEALQQDTEERYIYRRDDPTKATPLGWHLISGYTTPEMDAKLSGITSGISHGVAVDKIANVPPASPTAAEAFIVGTTPTGTFAGHANEVAIFDAGAWKFRVAVKGESHVNAQTNEQLTWNGTAWVNTGSLTVPIVAVTGAQWAQLVASTGGPKSNVIYAIKA